MKRSKKKEQAKYLTESEIVYGNVISSEIKEQKRGKKFALFLLLFAIITILVIIGLFFAFFKSGSNVNEFVPIASKIK
ncbi:hypothetical protein [Mesomycoplasma conjunctivae]|uniref:hypothetical protein n=1 Tax=Mesomycoplasma conjunctivae TaxID=45361 RepID=UPI003DA2BC1B